MNTKQECTKLQARIVTNPEVLVQSLADLSEEIQVERSLIHGLEKQARELQVHLEALQLTEQELSRTTKQLEDCSEAMHRRNETEACLASIKESLVQTEVTSKETIAREAQLRRQLTAQTERIELLTGQQANKRSLVDATLSSLRSDYEAISKERAAIQLKIDKNDRCIKELELKMADLKRSHEQELLGLTNAYQSLKQQVGIYTGDLTKQLEL